MMMMGAFLGPRKLMLIIFLGSLSGMIYGLIQVFRLRMAGEVPMISDEPTGVAPAESEAAKPEDDASAGSEPTKLEDDRPQNPAPMGQYRLPFGTFLAGSAIFVLFFGDRVLRWYGLFFPY